MNKEFIINVEVNENKAPNNVEEIIEKTLEEGFDVMNVANQQDYLEIKSIEHD